MLSNGIRRWIDFLKSNPKSARLGLLFYVVILALIASRIDITENLYNVLPDGAKFERFEKLTRNKDVLFSISFPDSTSPEGLHSVADGLADALKSTFSEELKNISIDAPYVDPGEVIHHYTKHLYSYLSEEQLQQALAKLNADSIKNRIRLNHSRLYTLESGYSKNLLFLDPLGLSSKKLKELQSYSEDSPFHEKGGVLILNKQRAILVKATATFEVSDLKLATAFKLKLESLKTEFKENGAQVDCFAGFLIAAANSEQIKADTWLTVFLTVIFIILLLLIFYRSVWAPLYFLIPGILGILFSLALISLSGREISGIALGAGAVVIGIVLDYSFHFFTHFKNSKSVTETINTITTPLLTSCLTTVLAFGALLFAETSILQDFGLFAALSLIGTAISILCILPVFLTDSTFSNKENYILRSPKTGRWLKRLLLVFIGVVTVFALKEAPNISFDTNLENLNFFPKELKTAEHNLLGLNSEKDRRIFLVARGKSDSEAQVNNYKLYNILQDENLNGVVASVLSTARYQVPATEQKRRLAFWNTSWEKFGEKYNLSNILDSLEAELGYTDDAFDRFKNSLQIDPEINPPPPFPLLAQLTKSLVDSSDEWSYLTYVHVAKGKEQEFHDAVDDIDGIVVLDRAHIAQGIFKMIQSDFNYIVLASALLVALTLLLVYGRIELTFITILPLIVGWIWIMGMASYFDLRFNLVNIIVTTFIFGLGDDYAIFITDGHLRQYRFGEKTLNVYRTSIILSGITTLLGTGVLILAQHPAIQSIAFISVVGMSSIIFLSLTLQPILLKAFIFGRAEKGLAPLTFASLLISVFAFSYFLLGCIILTFLQFFFRIVPFIQVRMRLLFCHILRLFAGSVVYIMINFRKRYVDMNNLDFKKPSVIIANHSSFVDILVMIMLNPRVILLTNDWVYNSPFFGLSVRYAGYIKAAHAIDDLTRVKKMVAEGYSIVIFPEGSRSWDQGIRRYHKGAFLLAERLKLDISPVLLHGIGYAMAKGDFLLKNTRITIKALPRIKFDDSQYGQTYKERTKIISRYIRKEYENMCAEIGDSSYLKLRVLNNFLYKTPALEWHARLRWWLDYRSFDYYHTLCPTEGKIYDLGCGYGILGFYLTYRSPKRKLIGVDADKEKIVVANHCYDKSPDLHFEHANILNVTIRDADVIFLGEELQYINGQDQERVLENCYSNLNEDGKIIISERVAAKAAGLDFSSLIDRWADRLAGYNKKKNQLYNIDRQAIELFAERHQMKIEIVEYSMTVSIGVFILSK